MTYFCFCSFYCELNRTVFGPNSNEEIGRKIGYQFLLISFQRVFEELQKKLFGDTYTGEITRPIEVCKNICLGFVNKSRLANNNKQHLSLMHLKHKEQKSNQKSNYKQKKDQTICMNAAQHGAPTSAPLRTSFNISSEKIYKNMSKQVYTLILVC